MGRLINYVQNYWINFVGPNRHSMKDCRSKEMAKRSGKGSYFRAQVPFLEAFGRLITRYKENVRGNS